MAESNSTSDYTQSKAAFKNQHGRSNEGGHQSTDPEYPRIVISLEHMKFLHDGEDTSIEKDLYERTLLMKANFTQDMVSANSEQKLDDWKPATGGETAADVTIHKPGDLNSCAQACDDEEGTHGEATPNGNAEYGLFSGYEELAVDENGTDRDERSAFLFNIDEIQGLRHLWMGQDDDLLEMIHNLLLENELASIPLAYPLGGLTTTECLVCYSRVTLNLRPCCDFPVCNACLEAYFHIQVSDATVKISCPNSDCSQSVHRAEILDRLSVEMKVKFNQFLVDANKEPDKKTCPRCSAVMSVEMQALQERRTKKYGLQVECVECAFVWCFPCQAPWHEGIKCKEHRRGDKLVKTWARERPQGQINAQRCPSCKIFIQRSVGCDHMTCSHCNTHFCYQCGEKFREFKFIGNHYSRLSIFGCKHLYKADKPVQRKLIRGSIFGAKLLAAPLLGGLAIGAGAVVAGLGLVALPFYGGYRLHKKLRRRKNMKLFLSMPSVALHDFHPQSLPPLWDAEMTTNLSDTLPVDRSTQGQNLDEGLWAIPSSAASDGFLGKRDAAGGAVEDRNTSSLPDRRRTLLRSCSDLEGRASTKIRQLLVSEGDVENIATIAVEASCNLPTVKLESPEVLGCPPAPDLLIPAKADRQPAVFEAGRFDPEASGMRKSKYSEVFV